MGDHFRNVCLIGFILVSLLAAGCGGHSGPRAADEAPDPGIDPAAATRIPTGDVSKKK
jgi:hypothetical protein